MQIIDLSPDDDQAVEQTATLLFESFRVHSPNAWSDMDAAREEVSELFETGKISRVAVDENRTILGWIGGSPEYDGNVWELHPLAVHPDHQLQGIGRALVADLEKKVWKRGGVTIVLGTDDEDNRTTLGGVDLYPNVWAHIANIKNLHMHPYEFYQKMGFVIVGVLPDANSLGKPDIIMAKRIG